eukprot:1147314-Pelagomonas_calceolata.AAC.11
MKDSANFGLAGMEWNKKEKTMTARSGCVHQEKAANNLPNLPLPQCATAGVPGQLTTAWPRHMTAYYLTGNV